MVNLIMSMKIFCFIKVKKNRILSRIYGNLHAAILRHHEIDLFLLL